jgi:peroxiredoxin Q/BCP
MKIRIFLVGLCQLLGICSVEAKSLAVGAKAPEFVLLNQDGAEVSLASYKGQNIALYFYPMDGTWGCTQQACSLRDGFKELKDAGITIIGISSDSVKSHKKFKEKNHLPFVILSDAKQKVAELYGVARGFLFSWMGTKRVTFLIDKKGIILAVIKDIDLNHHADQIISVFKHK